MTAKTKQPGFEEKLKTLEETVQKLEAGNLSLEESLDLFEQGIHLSRELQKALESAHVRITRLLDDGSEVPLEKPGMTSGDGDEENGSPE
ncbi:MAG: exodeoxyribonuclease VII small subunit [Acidobacteriota bacterium]|jgi:exodeoxyribonuclease VII small subunit